MPSESSKGGPDSRLAPDQVTETLHRHMLLDASPIVFDPVASRDCRLVDAATGRSYLDFFMFYATMPMGYNHPRLIEPDFLKRLTISAVNKASNTDYHSTYKAEFVRRVEQVAMPPQLPNFFFIAGGALAVENALKAAFDWKVRKNFARGQKKEIGTQVIHFREAFHGRSGYTLSLTNTNPAKTDYFPKFDWPRITNPKVTFPLEASLDEVIAAENQAKQEIETAIDQHGNDIAALIIEPIQGEGGDNHFRPEFFQYLREVTEQNEIIFILDEVQTGVGITGKFWGFEHTGVVPDIIAFGKKMQVSGIMASDKLNEVDSVFKVAGRINSTWGSHFTDLVRGERFLQIIAEDNLVEKARLMGEKWQEVLRQFQDSYSDLVTNARGLGLMTAFNLPDGDIRQRFVSTARRNGFIVAGCGPRSIRFRPPLNVTQADIDKARTLLEKTMRDILA
jgi:L-lysine 6-transaminase